MVTLLAAALAWSAAAARPHRPGEAAATGGERAFVLPAGGQSLVVARAGPVSKADPEAQYVEPWLAVNPTDPDNLIAVAMDIGARGLRSAVWASRDAGRTWTRAAHGDGSDSSFADGDPMVAFGPDGTAYFTTLADGFSVWRSRDGGFHWGEPTHVPGGSYDRQWVAVDASGGSFHGRIYTAGKVRIEVFGSVAQSVMAMSRSEDGGESYPSPRLLLPDPGSEVLHAVTDLRVTNDGVVVAPFLTFFWRGPGDGPNDGRLTGRFSVVRSEDGGRSFSGPYEVAPMHSFGHAEPELSNKALGGGRIALDRSSGRLAGRIYLTWVEAVGRALHIVVANSADGGRTWGAPVRANAGGLESANGNPAIAVNHNGTVLVTWNDRRDDPGERCFRVYGAVSRNGGAGFEPDFPIGGGRACPQDRFVNGGDTQGLAALPDGRFVAAWIREVDGDLRVWASTLQPPTSRSERGRQP
jgi:hypothetical protein